MPTEDVPPAVDTPKPPVTIALAGLTEPEASYVLQRLNVALPDAGTRRFDDLCAVTAALQGAEKVPVVVLGSSLAPAERYGAPDVLGAAGATVLDVDDWKGQLLPPAAPRPAESLLAVAVRAALVEQVVSHDVAPLLSEADLVEAMRGDQLDVHYQPIVDLARREVVSLEALVRWRHPELGLLPPELFIPLAESSGLIIELGRWVLMTACHQAAAWHRQGLRLEMAVNVSVHQVTNPAFVSDVRRALGSSGLSPEHLVLEVTESAVTEDVEAAAAALTQIRGTGATVAIDDFGTGYSSLIHLKRYPISVLKVDRSFVAGLGRNSDDDAIVSSVVSLARGVGAVCIAEGVETPEQHAHLLALGCDRAQGFLFSPAVSAVQVPAAVDAAEARAARVAPPLTPGRRAARPAMLPVPDEVLAHMRQLVDSGASYPTVAAALNQMGSLHPKGTRWHRTSVARFIQDHLSAQPQEMA